MSDCAAAEIRVVSSMATRRLLADLVALFESDRARPRVILESVGGVDAAKRVDAGEPFDVVVLADGALDGLIARGRVQHDSRVALVRSPIALAVRAGAPQPDISSETSVRQALLAARAVGYSTGPSGDHLKRLFARWDASGTAEGRLVQAPPGVPIAALVARGDVEVGVQQLSELMHADDIAVVGLLPPTIQHVTTFAGGVTTVSAQPDAGRALLAFLASPAAAVIARRHGMDPAMARPASPALKDSGFRI